MYRLILLLFITCTSGINLYEFSKHPESYQPDGSIQDKFLFKSPRIIFNKIYKRHTNFALETINKSPTFGETFSFSPLSHCKNEYNKNLAIKCLKDSPSNWWCIYDACISPSKPRFHYVKITLPPLYKHNNITQTCNLIT
jgi:hypothetical protein